MSGLVLCARSDPKHGDRFVVRPDLTPLHKPCLSCGEDLLVAPTSAALPDVEFACNPCGNRLVADRGVRKLGIAPGALPGLSPDERRRRSTLEAHGFRDIE